MKFYLGAVLLGIGSGFLPEQQSPMGLLVMAIVFLVLGQIVRLIFPMQSLQYQSWVLEKQVHGIHLFGPTDCVHSNHKVCCGCTSLIPLCRRQTSTTRACGIFCA